MLSSNSRYRNTGIVASMKKNKATFRLLGQHCTSVLLARPTTNHRYMQGHRASTHRMIQPRHGSTGRESCSQMKHLQCTNAHPPDACYSYICVHNSAARSLGHSQLATLASAPLQAVLSIGLRGRKLENSRGRTI